jgi:hypothetical protein
MNAVVQFQPAVDTYGSRSLTAADIRAQVNLIKDVMMEVMQEGTHYGKIPGTNGKSLWKAGAEKLMATFRLAAKPEVEDLSIGGEIAYRVVVNLLSANGAFVGAGVGECSSAEEKYSWRAAVHSKEWDATPDNRRRVKFYRDGKEVQQVRTNPADVANTILKMAKKRAQVDAVITATAASDIFTQDTPARATVVSRQVAPPEDSPERDALYASLQDIATAGTEAYAQSWQGLTADQRKMIGGAAHEGLKQKAAQADAEVAG